MPKGIIDRGVSTGCIKFGQSTKHFRAPKHVLRGRMKLGPSGQRFDGNGRHGVEVDDRLKCRLEIFAKEELVEYLAEWIAH
jgi:hypothetical protein